jgi:hypothetical protein
LGNYKVACPNVTKSVDVFVRPEDAERFTEEARLETGGQI